MFFWRGLIIDGLCVWQLRGEVSVDLSGGSVVRRIAVLMISQYELKIFQLQFFRFSVCFFVFFLKF